MLLNKLLEQRGMTKYRLAKESGIPQTTIFDICSGKAHIEKCSAETLYKIAKTLDVTMESLIEAQITEQKKEPARSSFEVFKSNVCHTVKDKGDFDFILESLNQNQVRTLFNRKWYAEAFYLLAMIDYLSRINNIPLCTDYNDIRKHKLQEPLYPTNVQLLSSAMNTTEFKEKSLENAIPEFMQFNIIESEVRNVF